MRARVRLAPEHRERLEERWSHPSAGDRYADGRLGLAQPAPYRLTDVRRDLVEHVPLPDLEGPVVGGGSGEDDGAALVLDDCLDERGVVDARLVEEEEVDHAGHLPEGGHPFLDERGNGAEGRLFEPIVRPRCRTSAQPRTAGLDELVDRHSPYVFAVHVGELDHVEKSRGVVHVLEPEPLHHLVAIEDLLAVGRPPAEQPQVIDEGVGQVALVAVGLDGDRVAPLGQLLPLFVDEHGQMGEDGQRRDRSGGTSAGVALIGRTVRRRAVYPTEPPSRHRRAPARRGCPSAWWAAGPRPGSRG